MQVSVGTDYGDCTMSLFQLPANLLQQPDVSMQSRQFIAKYVYLC